MSISIKSVVKAFIIVAVGVAIIQTCVQFASPEYHQKKEAERIASEKHAQEMKLQKEEMAKLQTYNYASFRGTYGDSIFNYNDVPNHALTSTTKNQPFSPVELQESPKTANVKMFIAKYRTFDGGVVYFAISPNDYPIAFNTLYKAAEDSLNGYGKKDTMTLVGVIPTLADKYWVYQGSLYNESTSKYEGFVQLCSDIGNYKDDCALLTTSQASSLTLEMRKLYNYVP